MPTVCVAYSRFEELYVSRGLNQGVWQPCRYGLWNDLRQTTIRFTSFYVFVTVIEQIDNMWAARIYKIASVILTTLRFAAWNGLVGFLPTSSINNYSTSISLLSVRRHQCFTTVWFGYEINSKDSSELQHHSILKIVVSPKIILTEG